QRVEVRVSRCIDAVVELHPHAPSVVYFLFFFQAEDGIRDRNVTGVQTCALPILYSSFNTSRYSSYNKLASCSKDAHANIFLSWSFNSNRLVASLSLLI